MSNMLEKLSRWFGFGVETEPRVTKHDYVIGLILKAKRHEREMGNNPTKITISDDLMEILESNTLFLMDDKYDRIFGLEVNVDYDKELYLSVD